MSCYRFRQRDCTCTWSNTHRLGKPLLISLETVAGSGHHVHTQERSGSETSIFERSTFGSVFEKLRFGARAFSKSSGSVRISLRVTVSIYPGSKGSVFEKTRVCARSLSVLAPSLIWAPSTKWHSRCPTNVSPLSSPKNRSMRRKKTTH